MLELLTVGMALVSAAADTVQVPSVITLEQALQIALSENTSVKVADAEIQRTKYAKKGAYAALYPQVDASGSFQRTLKKQVMYIDMPGMSSDGIEVGRWNSWSAGVTAAMPLVNAQLWKSLEISGQDVELAVEKARSSRLDMVTQVKQAYYQVLLAREVRDVYKDVYENAKANFDLTQKKYNAQKASELDLTRAKATLANAVPNLYDSESSVLLALWQLKAVMGVDLDMEIDVTGHLDQCAGQMLRDLNNVDTLSLSQNTTLKQLGIQAEQLANSIQAQKYAYLPSLALSFNYSVSAMANDFSFSEYKWSPYSMVGLSLSIPIFSGFKRLNAVKQGKVQAAELEYQRKDTERQLRIAIRQYVKTMETNMNSYYAAQDALETARKAFSIAQKSYNVGHSTLTDLNDAQLALVQSELNVSQCLFNFLVAKSNLEKTLGYDYDN